MEDKCEGTAVFELNLQKDWQTKTVPLIEFWLVCLKFFIIYTLGIESSS